MQDKVFIVTGAARGIGLAIAQQLGIQGARMVVTDLDREACAQAAQQLTQQGIEALGVAGNVASGMDVATMAAQTVARFGRIDGIVNNAGGSAHTPLHIEDVTEEQFDRVMDWNVKGTFLCIQAVLPHLKVQGGSIVNIASISGRAGSELLSPQYSAAKAAIIGMTRNLAKHLGRHGIRVNALAPGFIRSGPRAEEIWSRRDETTVLKDLPLGRRGEMSEIGDVTAFLLGEASSYITGAVIDVNGGYFTA